MFLQKITQNIRINVEEKINPLQKIFFIFTLLNLPNQNVKKNHITIPYISTVN